MKLVLDEHYSPTIAQQLRERGYDVIAVAEATELREMPDEDLLRWAREAGRVVVTEDVRDFMILHSAYLSRGEMHAGILFTNPRTFPRRTDAVGRLITAVAAFMDGATDDGDLHGDIAWL